MKSFKITPKASLPLIYVRVQGQNRDKKVKLVFDTGAFMSQLSTLVIEELGYSARDGISPIIAQGPSGPLDEGYTIDIESLEVFGKKFSKQRIATYDFNNLEAEGIDGLLGFDIIRQLHLELDGPNGELIVFDT